MSASDEASRAAARRAWPVQKKSLADDAGDDLSDTTTAEERLAMMWPLARDGWAIMGRSLPTYARHESPGVLLRGEGREG